MLHSGCFHVGKLDAKLAMINLLCLFLVILIPFCIPPPPPSHAKVIVVYPKSLNSVQKSTKKVVSIKVSE